MDLATMLVKIDDVLYYLAADLSAGRERHLFFHPNTVCADQTF